jgi:hypothetical protein
MSVTSTDPDSPFAERPRPSQFEPTALDLARIAAAIDPILSKKEPAKAVRLAQNLIAAAQDYINEPSSRHRDEVEYWQEHARKRWRERLFPAGDCVSLSDAFKLWPGKYKTSDGLARALRKEHLTITDSEHRELTSKQAVEELAKIHDEKEKARDRSRKSKPTKQNLHKSRREREEQKAEDSKLKRGS